jgi:hypothetical protein
MEDRRREDINCAVGIWKMEDVKIKNCSRNKEECRWQMENRRSEGGKCEDGKWKMEDVRCEDVKMEDAK